MRTFFLLSICWVSSALGWPFFAQGIDFRLTDDEFFDMDIVPAANQLHKYYDFIKDKRIGLVVNHTSMVEDKHLVDVLLEKKCTIKRIFAPEHGFRGKADAGEAVKSGKDVQTGLPIISLYGKNKKPTASQVEGLDLIIFDIQDVGARFYTYTSTMTYIMQTCAENDLPLLVLDRPNPNGHYVDGPVLQKEQASFVGLHPVPIVHGLTIAEYARMINEEGWLENNQKCELYHVECLNYNHTKYYQLPVAPSPNLPNMRSIYLYPSFCLFEGTTVSVGRGTNKQFQVIGHPKGDGQFSFTPTPQTGAKHPKHQGKTCKGIDFSQIGVQQLQKNTALELNYLLRSYQQLTKASTKDFFLANNFFNLLAGNRQLQAQVKEGQKPTVIRQSWQKDLTAYKKLRKKYLLYKDFEEQ